MFELAAIADLQSVFTLQSLYVIASLVVIEGLLSVDNALAIAAMASHLEPQATQASDDDRIHRCLRFSNRCTFDRVLHHQ